MTAAFIDSMRAVFGAEMINAAIKGGLDGSGEFYARENGVEVGSRPLDVPGRAVNGLDMAPSFAPRWKK